MRTNLAILLSAGALSLLGFTVASANQNHTIACLQGIAREGEIAELGQSVGTSDWDSRGGMSLESSIGNVGLRVLDMSGTSVCQETANNATSCTFRLGNSPDSFQMFVDNSQNTAVSLFRLCSF